MPDHRSIFLIIRRAVLVGLLAMLVSAMSGLGAAPAQAAGGSGADPEKLRYIQLPPLAMPGKDRFSYINMVIQLKVRGGETMVQDTATVWALQPRILARLIEDLTERRILSIQLSPEEVKGLKDRILTVANEACEAPLIEEIYILSLVLN